MIILCVIVLAGIVIFFGCHNYKERDDDKSFFFDGASEYNSEDFEFMERHEEENR